MCFEDLLNKIYEDTKDINESEGPEHERLKTELKKWARNMRYDKDGPRFKGKNPDVVLTNQDVGKLFVGDAKDAKKGGTVENDGDQIKGYVDEFLCCLEENGYKEGIFAIATNDQDAAKKWCGYLSELTKRTFKILEINPVRTWLSWHCF